MPTEIKKPITINNFLGMFSRKSSHLIGRQFLANSKNISVADGSLAPWKQYTAFANTVTGGVDDHIILAYTTVKADGTEIPLRVREDGSNTHWEWYNSVDEAWDVLLPNLTTAKIPQFADFNTSTQDEVWGCNGTENMTLWTKIVGSVASNTSTVITLNEVAATAGFSSGTIIVDGTEYSYSGISGSTLTGLTGLPTFDANEGVAQAADDSTYSALPKMDILYSNRARMWGAISTKPRLYYSEVGDATNWTTASNPDDPGFRDFVEGEGGLTGISGIKENIFAFKKDLVQLYRLEFPSATTRTSFSQELRRGNSKGAIYKHGIAKIGQEIMYVTETGGIKSIDVNDTDDGFKFDSTTDRIRPTIKNGVFTDARMTWNEKERVLLCAYKADSDSTRNDRIVTVEMVKQDNESLFPALGIMDWTVGGWFDYDGDKLFGSSFEANTFKAFDGFSKDGNAFETIVSTKRFSFGNFTNQKEIDWFLLMGFISQSTTLNLTADYDANGSRASINTTFSGNPDDHPDDKNYIIEGALNTIGAFALGTEPIGGTTEDISELNPFRVIFTMPRSIHPFDLQLTISTDAPGSRYRLDVLSYDVKDAGITVPDTIKKTFK